MRLWHFRNGSYGVFRYRLHPHPDISCLFWARQRRSEAHRSVIHLFIRAVTFNFIHDAILDTPGIWVFESLEFFDELVGWFSGPGTDGYEFMLNIGSLSRGRVNEEVLKLVTLLSNLGWNGDLPDRMTWRYCQWRYIPIVLLVVPFWWIWVWVTGKKCERGIGMFGWYSVRGSEVRMGRFGRATRVEVSGGGHLLV